MSSPLVAAWLCLMTVFASATNTPPTSSATPPPWPWPSWPRWPFLPPRASSCSIVEAMTVELPLAEKEQTAAQAVATVGPGAALAAHGLIVTDVRVDER